MASDRLAPAWDLELNDGSRLPLGMHALVNRVQVKATVDGADELVIEAAAESDKPGHGAVAILGDHRLAPGNRVVVWGGYADGVQLAQQRFTMIREEVSYPEQGPITVTLRGYSAEQQLVEYTDARSYPAPSNDALIVSEIADEFGLSYTGLTIETTPDRQVGRVKKKGDSDLAFLQQLALDNGYGPPIIRYDADKGEDVLYFRETNLLLQEEQATFVYNPDRALSEQPSGTLYSFRSKLSLAGVPTKVEVLGWDPEAQEAIRVVAEITGGGQTTTVYNGSAAEITEAIRSGAELQVAVLQSTDDAQGERREVVVVSGIIRTSEDALAYAERWLRTRQLAFQTADATTVGYEALWVGQVHRYEGLAPHHDGLYEVLDCTHTWDGSGYRCRHMLRRVLEEAQAPVEGS